MCTTITVHVCASLDVHGNDRAWPEDLSQGEGAVNRRVTGLLLEQEHTAVYQRYQRGFTLNNENTPYSKYVT